MGRIALISVLLFVSAPSVQLASAQEVRPAVFIGPQIRDGFLDIDSGIRDSIRDIALEFRPDPGRRETIEFNVVNNREHATLVVTVLARGIVTNGSIGFGTSSAATGFGVGFVYPNTVPTLTTVLGVGRYERRMQSEGGTWRAAAKVVVQDVRAWWEANHKTVAQLGK